MTALSTAYFGAGVHHRDISKSNTMMSEEREGRGGRYGVLIDWDHAKRIGTVRSDPFLLRSVR